MNASKKHNKHEPQTGTLRGKVTTFLKQRLDTVVVFCWEESLTPLPQTISLNIQLFSLILFGSVLEILSPQFFSFEKDLFMIRTVACLSEIRGPTGRWSHWDVCLCSNMTANIY